MTRQQIDRTDAGIEGKWTRSARVLLMTGLAAAAAMAAVLPPAFGEPAGETRCYRERTGDRSQVRRWRMEPRPDGFHVRSVIGAEQYLNLVHGGGETAGWSAKNDRMRISACRNQEILVIQGTFEGRSIRRQHDFGAVPWFQSTGFSLERFFRGKEERVVFWMLRPETLEPILMQAEKQEVETVPVEGQTERARRVELRLAGWRSILWHGDYWFRESGGEFIKYAGVNGPPGTPETEVERCREACGAGDAPFPEMPHPCPSP